MAHHEVVAQAELAAALAAVRSEMAALRAELRNDMVRAALDAEVARLKRWAAGVIAANGVAVISALLL